MKQLLFILAFIPSILYADTYWVAFRDKIGTDGDFDKPETFLSEQALALRSKYHIEIDSLDLPISQVYYDSVLKYVDKIHYPLRWHNGVVVEASSSQISQISSWLFIDTIQCIRYNSHSDVPRRSKWEKPTNDKPYGYASQQAQQINLLPLHALGFEGQGITMAICDGTFYNVDTCSAFDSVRSQILGFYDFTDEGLDFFGPEGGHGIAVFSTIAANTSFYKGTATKATYYLMASEENATESPKEMYNLEAALEKADSLGVHVFSASLGYAYFDHSPFDLAYKHIDGKSSCSQAATIAARKGMIVCIAAGNEGNDDWHYITIPADADSIITVGGVTNTGAHSIFSSYGPTQDGRTKPEICARASNTYIIDYNGSAIQANGTSFATPIIAGSIASLWSALPDLNNMQIRQLLLQTASQTSMPDNTLGYGIADIWSAYASRPSAYIPTFHQIEGTNYYDILGHQLINKPSMGVYISVKNGKAEIQITK